MVQFLIISSLKVHQVIDIDEHKDIFYFLQWNLSSNFKFYFLVFSLGDFITRQMAWVWLLWLLSQTWITIHIWTPKAERLASTEKLFVLPMYNGLLIDQSMALNRKRDDQKDVKTEVYYNITVNNT